MAFPLLFFARIAEACDTKATLNLEITVRDFYAADNPAGGFIRYPDFEMPNPGGFVCVSAYDLPKGCTPPLCSESACRYDSFNGLAQGQVEKTLGVDGMPVYRNNANDPNAKHSIHGQRTFDGWWHSPSPFANSPSKEIKLPLVLKKECPSGMFTFSSDSFFPLDSNGLAGEKKFNGGTDNKPHNFGFTDSLHTEFIYQGNEVFEFVGDDDVWVFIDNTLVIDLGGLHQSICRRISLADPSNIVPQGGVVLTASSSCPGTSLPSEKVSLNLIKGKSYSLDFFHAERHTTASNFKMSTNMLLKQECTVADCQSKHGPNSKCDCNSQCVCEPGFLFDDAQQCSSCKDSACADLLGPNGQCDCSGNCACKPGYGLDDAGKCSVPRSTQMCSMWPDPHFRTFDGCRFDYHGTCDYILAKGPSTDDAQRAEVQIRGFKDPSWDWSGVNQVALLFGADVVNIDLKGVSVNGKSVSSAKGATLGRYGYGVTGTVPAASTYLFNIPHTSGTGSDTIKVVSHPTWGPADAMGVEISAVSDARSRFWNSNGLCGLYDLNVRNDLTVPKGNVVNDTNYFATAWVPPAASTKLSGSNDLCTKLRSCPDPIIPKNDTCKGKVTFKEAEVLCEKAKKFLPDYNACLFDACIGGNPSLIEQPPYEPKCPEDCNAGGTCKKGKCECFPGYNGPSCQQPTPAPTKAPTVTPPRPTCSTYKCPSNTNKKPPGPTPFQCATSGCLVTDCCSPLPTPPPTSPPTTKPPTIPKKFTCSDYTCPADYIERPPPPTPVVCVSVGGCQPQECCDAGKCTVYKCPANTVPKTNSDTLTCSDFGCKSEDCCEGPTEPAPTEPEETEPVTEPTPTEPAPTEAVPGSCVDHVCSAGVTKSGIEEYQCLSAPCTDEECCVLPTPKSRTCSEYQCPDDLPQKPPGPTPFVCEGENGCTNEDCCETPATEPPPTPTCAGYTCPFPSVLTPESDPPVECASSEGCTDDECCTLPLPPSCESYTCPTGSTTKPPSSVGYCDASGCMIGDCCDVIPPPSRPTCDVYQCAAGNMKKPGELLTECAIIGCTESNCCSPSPSAPPMCDSFSCPPSKTRVAMGVACVGGACDEATCCQIPDRCLTATSCTSCVTIGCNWQLSFFNGMGSCSSVCTVSPSQMTMLTCFGGPGRPSCPVTPPYFPPYVVPPPFVPPYSPPVAPPSPPQPVYPVIVIPPSPPVIPQPNVPPYVPPPQPYTPPYVIPPPFVPPYRPPVAPPSPPQPGYPIFVIPPSPPVIPQPNVPPYVPPPQPYTPPSVIPPPFVPPYRPSPPQPGYPIFVIPPSPPVIPQPNVPPYVPPPQPYTPPSVIPPPFVPPYRPPVAPPSPPQPVYPVIVIPPSPPVLPPQPYVPPYVPPPYSPPVAPSPPVTPPKPNVPAYVVPPPLVPFYRPPVAPPSPPQPVYPVFVIPPSPPVLPLQPYVPRSFYPVNPPQSYVPVPPQPSIPLTPPQPSIPITPLRPYIPVTPNVPLTPLRPSVPVTPYVPVSPPVIPVAPPSTPQARYVCMSTGATLAATPSSSLTYTTISQPQAFLSSQAFPVSAYPAGRASTFPVYPTQSFIQSMASAISPVQSKISSFPQTSGFASAFPVQQFAYAPQFTAMPLRSATAGTLPLSIVPAGVAPYTFTTPAGVAPYTFTAASAVAPYTITAPAGVPNTVNWLTSTPMTPRVASFQYVPPSWTSQTQPLVSYSGTIGAPLPATKSVVSSFPLVPSMMYLPSTTTTFVPSRTVSPASSIGQNCYWVWQ